MSLSNLNFHSDELKKAITAASTIIGDFDAARDRQTEDIKALEFCIKESGLKIPFCYSLGKSFYDFPGANELSTSYSLEYGGTASGEIREDCIVWGLDKNQQFRLLFEQKKWDGGVDVDIPTGPYYWDETTFFSKAWPLVDVGFEDRKRAYMHLPEFVKALAEYLLINKQSVQLEQLKMK